MASSNRSTKKKQKGLKPRPYISKLFSLFLIILGGVILIAASYTKISTPLFATDKKASTLQETIDKPNLLAKPYKLYIPRLSKVLYVSAGTIVNNRWTISDNGVSYLTSSTLPGHIGNSVLYGHNKRDILGGLPKIKEGDSVYVILKSGDFVKYQVFETREVKPGSVEILENTNDSRLTIYTCSGFLDKARFVVVAKLALST